MLQRTRIFIALAILAAFTTVTVTATQPGGGAAGAAYSAFVKIEGIRGEEKGWIGIHEIFSQPLSIAELPAGKVPTETRGTSKQEGTFTLIRSAGKATPKLAEAVCKSANLEDLGVIVLELCRTDGDNGVYLRFVLENCLISSYAIELGDTEGSITETFTLNYGSVMWEYEITVKEEGVRRAPTVVQEEGVRRVPTVVQEDGVRRAPVTINEPGVRKSPVTINEEGVRRAPITVNEEGIRRAPITVNEEGIPSPRKR